MKDICRIPGTRLGMRPYKLPLSILIRVSRIFSIRDIRFFVNTILCMDRRTLFIHKRSIFRYNKAIEKSISTGLPKQHENRGKSDHYKLTFSFFFLLSPFQTPRIVQIRGVWAFWNSCQSKFIPIRVPRIEFRSGVFVWLKKRVSAERSVTAWKSLCLICIYLRCK